MTNNTDWAMICKAYCKRIGAELLFVNDADFGYEKDNKFYHINADELMEIIENWGCSNEE